MKFALRSDGGVTEAFLHAENPDTALEHAARHIAQDHGLPVHLELWSTAPDGRTPHKLADFRFVAITHRGDVIDL